MKLRAWLAVIYWLAVLVLMVAAKALAARDEVDLDHLTGALLNSVGESFQPEHVSLRVPAKPDSGRVIAASRTAARTG